MKKLKAVPSENQDVEKLAEEAKLKRQLRCSERINKILEEEKCQFTIFVQVGESVFPLSEVIKLPVVLQATSK